MEKLFWFFYISKFQGLVRGASESLMGWMWQMGKRLLLLDFADLPCFPYPPLILSFPFTAHHLQPLIWLLNLSLTEHTLCGSTEATAVYLPHSRTEADWEAIIWHIGCCGRMKEWWIVLSIISYAWKQFMSFCSHFIVPPSNQLQRNGDLCYKVPGMRTRTICQH